MSGMLSLVKSLSEEKLSPINHSSFSQRVLVSIYKLSHYFIPLISFDLRSLWEAVDPRRCKDLRRRSCGVSVLPTLRLTLFNVPKRPEDYHQAMVAYIRLTLDQINFLSCVSHSIMSSFGIRNSIFFRYFYAKENGPGCCCEFSG